MRNLSVLIVVLSAVTLFLVAGEKSAQKTYFSGTDTSVAVLDPGTATFPDGRVKARGLTFQAAMASNLGPGDLIVVANANWDGMATGPAWGTFVVTFPDEGYCEGTWSGKRTFDWEAQPFPHWVSFLKGVGQCTDGAVDGSQMKWEEEVHTFDPVPADYVGYIEGWLLNPNRD